jgi:hypothetical protein
MAVLHLLPIFQAFHWWPVTAVYLCLPKCLTQIPCYSGACLYPERVPLEIHATLCIRVSNDCRRMLGPSTGKVVSSEEYLLLGAALVDKHRSPLTFCWDNSEVYSTDFWRSPVGVSSRSPWRNLLLSCPVLISFLPVSLSCSPHTDASFQQSHLSLTPCLSVVF